MTKKIAVIGGGAAGFFAAVNAAHMNPETEVLLLEKTQKLLSKVKVSGGGRCNVTNHCFDNAQLIKNYPRGEKELRGVFSRFAVKDTIEWFESRGVELKAEADGRMFPVSDSSQTIIDTLMNEADKFGVKIKTGCEVESISKNENGFVLNCGGGNFTVDKIIIASGGHNNPDHYSFIAQLGHTIKSPIPSLFTFNLTDKKITELMGLSVPEGFVKIAGTKLSYKGPVLITHWGLSGPAVLKLSAFAAEYFFKQDYNNSVIVNWTGIEDREEFNAQFDEQLKKNAKAFPASKSFFFLPARLWNYLLVKSEIDFNKNWSEQKGNAIQKLKRILSEDVFEMKGKTTFKEEFVTCGGVSLKEVDMRSMESKLVPGVYFAGEALDIDGITGGFNFQAAWSTAFIAAESATHA